MTRRTLLNAALISLTLTACGGGGSSTPSATIASIDLTPPAATVPIGDTTPLTATARDAQGSVVPNAAFTWTSSAENVATVTGGVVTGKAAGRAQVTATAAGVTSAPAELTVTAPTPAAGFTLAVSADKLPVITGTSASLTVTVTRDAGFTDAVAITLNGLPSGATAPTVTLPAGQTSATVTVSAPHSQPTEVTVERPPT
ncbi:Ig-like domain-containing protein [Deinococcus sp. AB2017081]|nr:Ig-like domain-containing protein [Deinococcus sp. AB2017081]WQE97307.1 Ig-like domain-containing protein [Deinococcus sp. AB2017081]